MLKSGSFSLKKKRTALKYITLANILGGCFCQGKTEEEGPVPFLQTWQTDQRANWVEATAHSNFLFLYARQQRKGQEHSISRILCSSQDSVALVLAKLPNRYILSENFLKSPQPPYLSYLLLTFLFNLTKSR